MFPSKALGELTSLPLLPLLHLLPPLLLWLPTLVLVTNLRQSQVEENGIVRENSEGTQRKVIFREWIDSEY